MICFAGNSLLCRLALPGRRDDASSFTAVRLGSAALVMAVLAHLGSRERSHAGSWILRARPVRLRHRLFPRAYVQIGAGLGALLLFGTVQLTMIGWGLARGERPAAPSRPAWPSPWWACSSSPIPRSPGPRWGAWR